MSSVPGRPPNRGSFTSGQSGNPGGRITNEAAIERARPLFTPADLAKLGLASADELTIEHVAAMRMRINILVLLAGPRSEKDSVWSKVNEDFGNRIHGKQVDTVAIGTSPEQLAILEALKLTPLQRKARAAELAEGGDDAPLDAPEPDEPG